MIPFLWKKTGREQKTAHALFPNQNKRLCYPLMRTTMAPMKSPFFQSFLVVLGCLLWQSAQP